jgi:hypothetical protein
MAVAIFTRRKLSVYFVGILMFYYVYSYAVKTISWSSHQEHSTNDEFIESWVNSLNGDEQIIQIIHFSSRFASLSNDQQIVYDKWKKFNPEFELRIYSDYEVDRFIRLNYPEFKPLFDSVYSRAERVDIWKYLVVHKYGGFYCDLDLIPLQPLLEWIDYVREQSPVSPKIILTVDTFKENGLIRTFADYGFYSFIPGHPLFYNTAMKILHSFMDELDEGEFKGDSKYRTGTIPFTKAIWNYSGTSIKAISIIDDYHSSSLKDIFILRRRFKGFADHIGSCSNQDSNPNRNKLFNSLLHQWQEGQITLVV